MTVIPFEFKSVRDRILLISPFFFWGTAMVAMKGVIPHTGPFFLAAVRILPAGFLVVLVSLLLRRSQPKGWQAWAWIILFGLVDGSLFQGFLAQGLMRTGAGLGSVMIDSQPLAVAILAFFLYGERVGGFGWLGLLIGVAGISFIGFSTSGFPGISIGSLRQNLAVQNLTGISWADVGNWCLQGLNQGEILMLLAALSMAMGTVMIRKVSQYADAISATGWHMVIGALPLMLGSFLWEPNAIGSLTLSHWGAIAYSSVFGSAIAYGLFFWFAATGNLTSLSSLTFLTPVFALIFGNLFLGEILNSVQVFGVSLTLVSIFMVNQRERLPELLNKVLLGRDQDEQSALGLRASPDEVERGENSHILPDG